MAVGVLVLWVFHYLRKREHDAADPDGQVTRKYLEVNVAVYGSIVIGILFFWNWIDHLVQCPGGTERRPSDILGVHRFGAGGGAGCDRLPTLARRLSVGPSLPWRPRCGQPAGFLTA